MGEFLLKICCFPGKHTSVNISSELRRITEEWGIRQKVLANVMHNGLNIVSAVHKARWRHYVCFTHTLNLVVKDAIKAVPEIVKLLGKLQ